MRSYSFPASCSISASACAVDPPPAPAAAPPDEPPPLSAGPPPPSSTSRAINELPNCPSAEVAANEDGADSVGDHELETDVAATGDWNPPESAAESAERLATFENWPPLAGAGGRPASGSERIGEPSAPSKERSTGRSVDPPVPGWTLTEPAVPDEGPPTDCSKDHERCTAGRLEPMGAKGTAEVAGVAEPADDPELEDIDRLTVPPRWLTTLAPAADRAPPIERFTPGAPSPPDGQGSIVTASPRAASAVRRSETLGSFAVVAAEFTAGHPVDPLLLESTGTGWPSLLPVAPPTVTPSDKADPAPAPVSSEVR